MPARPPSRGALAAVMFGGAALVAVLWPPGSAQPVGPAVTRSVASAVPVTGRDATPAGDVALDAAAFFGGSPAPAPTGAPSPQPPTDPDTPTPADLTAGIQRRTVMPAGGGDLDVVPGTTAAPGQGEVRTIRVEVERGLPVDGPRFAGFVLATLNDDRSWGHGGRMTFARTDGDAPITVVLASPDTSARLCGDLRTDGMLSCRNGPRAVLTFHRWVNATEEYTGNVTGYRQYLVNHEVGHVLGHGHERCPGPGQPAPVMQQQTLGLKGCAQNSWPHPAAAPAPAP